jgi:RHS repeat-associated protein
MSWNTFLSWMRRWLSPWTRRRRGSKASKNPRPLRRRTILEMEPFEDRFHPNDPLGMARLPLWGSGLGLLGAAMRPSERRTALTPTAAVAITSQTGSGTGHPPAGAASSGAFALYSGPVRPVAAPAAGGGSLPARSAPVAATSSAQNADLVFADPFRDPLASEWSATAAARSGSGPLTAASPSAGSEGAGVGPAAPAPAMLDSFASSPSLIPSPAIADSSDPVLAQAAGTLSPALSPRRVPMRSRPKASPLASPLAGGRQVPTPIPPSLLQSFGQLPVYFEANQGQTDAQAQFLARGNTYTSFLTANGPVLELPRGGPANADGSVNLDVVSFQYQGANTGVVPTGQDPLTSRSNYFGGSSGSVIDIPEFASVVYANYYSNIDLAYHAGVQNPNEVEYDYVVHPGGNANQIQFAVQGAQNLTLDAQGDLVITTPGGTLVDSAPAAATTSPQGALTPVTDSFVLLGGNLVGLQVGSYDPTQTLTIDPTLSFSTYLGGSGTDIGNGVAVDPAGNTYVTGSTTSSNFPITTGGSYSGVQESFVAKLNSTGSALIYATYVGGAQTSAGQAIAVDETGSAYITGSTNGSFPTTTGAYQTSYGGGTDAFVTKLNAAGDNLVHSTYLGGSGSDTGYGIAVDPAGYAYVTGSTASTAFPTTTGVFQSSLGGGTGQDAFVTKLKTDGSGLVYASYLGGSGSETGEGIALDVNGNAYVTGNTASTNFPTVSAYQGSLSGGAGQDAFVSKVNPTATTLTYSTYLGGAGTDDGKAIAVNLSGNAYITGSTTSTNFPTQNAYASSLGGTQDAFVTELGTAGNALTYSTYLGVSGTQTGRGIGLDRSGDATVVGDTNSTSFPTLNATQASFGGGTNDAFVTSFQPAGNTVAYSTYLGGSGSDQANAVAIDLQGNAYVTGSTTSTNFPTGTPEQGSNGGGTDAFITKISPKPLPPVFTSISTDTGSSSSDQITTDQTLTISGTAAANSTVTISRADVGVLGSVTANVSGNWTYDYTGTTLPEGTYAFTGTTTLSGQTSLPSNPFLVNVDLTGPSVLLTVPATTNSKGPPVIVSASDLNGLPNGTAVTLDVDKNNDGNFTDAGETGYATSTLTDGFASFTLPALPNTGTFPMRARVTDLAGNQGTSATATLQLTAAGSPWSLTGQVLSADPLDGRPLEQLGDLQLSHAVDLDTSPGTSQGGDPAFVYNSDSVSVAPIVQVGWQSDTNGSLPSSVTATLTWNGSVQASKTFQAGSATAGDVLTMALQAPTVTATGRYPWSVQVSSTGFGGNHSGSASGVAYIVVENNSPFGAGWTFGPVDQLVSIAADSNGPAGQLRLYGTGGWRFYTQGVGSTYTSPAGDPGTLVKNGDSSFTYSLPGGRTWNFNSSGYETSQVSADGLATLAYRYDGSNRLSGETAIDGTLSTFSYGTSAVTIVTANNRVTTLSLSSGVLSSITNPDGGADNFVYSGNFLTSESFGILSKSWAYGSNMVSSITLGGSGTPNKSLLKPAAAVGLWGYQGSSNNYIGGPVQGKLTDPNSHVLAWQLDGQGRPLQEVAQDGGVTVWTRDANTTWVTKVTDLLNRVTTYVRDSAGYVTQESLPDGNTQNYAYQSAFHALTTFTNERNYTTTYGYDSGGHQICQTDALGDVTTSVYQTNGLLQSVQDPRGNTTSYGYDSFRRQATVTDALNNVTSYSYDANGNPLTTIDARGDVTTMNYDVMGRETSQIDALGDITTWTYDVSDLPLTTKDALGRQTSMVYDSFGQGLVADNIEAVGNPVQRSTVESFDSAGQTTNERNADGYSTATVYDPAGRVIQTTNALGGVAKTVYDLDGEMVASRDELGRWTKCQYNARGWQTSVTDPAGNVTSYGYDAAGNRTTSTDALNHTTTFHFDALNRQTVTMDALGNSVTMQYDAVGNVATVTNQRGYSSQYSYDVDNRRTVVTEAVGTSVQRTSTTVYDAVDNVTAQTDGINTITYGYDKLNRQITVTDGLGHTTTTAYDAVGNTSSTTDALNKTTNYTYNGLNQQVSATDPLSQVTTSVVDPLGNSAAAINGLGKASQSPIDALGRQVYDVDALGGVTQRIYDAMGNMVSLIDPVGNQTNFVYDRLNRQILETDPNGSAVTSVYDAAGRMTSRTDQDSRVVTFAYDNANRQIGATWKDSGGNVVNTLTYSFDAVGNMLTAADKVGTITRSYDALNRLATDQNVFGQVLTYSYDAANRQTLRQDSLGGVLTSVYDAGSRLTSRQFGGTSQTPLRVDFAYDLRNELTTITRYSDLAGTQVVGTSAYSFDADGRLVNLNHTNGNGTSLDNFTYTYDAANRVQGEVRNGTPDATYTYDATDQLTGDGTHTYSYDANGNRTMAGYQTGTGNQLTNDGTWTYTYDNAGNLTQKSKGSGLETWYYGFDNANHMTSVRQTSDGSTNLLTVTYTYDFLADRVQQDKWETGGGTVTTRFAYDEQNIWADLDGTNTLQVRYLYGDASDQILARTVSSGQPNAGVSWYLTDHQGSVRDLEVASAVADHIDYAGFGIPTETQVNFGDRHKWTGREYDSDTSLQYNRARSQILSIGRWTSEDPKSFAMGDPNLYRYAHNNPTIHEDPTGLQEWANAKTERQLAEAYKSAGMTESKALAACKRQIAEWQEKGWNFAAHLLQHFIDKKGPAPYTPTPEDINEVAQKSEGALKRLLGTLARATVSRPADRVKVNDKITLTKQQVRWVETGAIGIVHRLMAKERYVDADNYMFYTYGGAGIELLGRVTNVDNREAGSSRGAYLRIVAKVTLSDDYDFEPPGPLNARLFFNTYLAAHYLQTTCGYQKFSHKMAFDRTYENVWYYYASPVDGKPPSWQNATGTIHAF